MENFGIPAKGGDDFKFYTAILHFDFSILNYEWYRRFHQSSKSH